MTANLAKTHCPQGHEYAGHNVRVRHGFRECRICRRLQENDRRRRRRREAGVSRARPIEVRFWEMVDKSGPTDCWLWTGYGDRWGYGRFGHGLLAHRVAFELVKGSVPPGLTLDHLCRVRRCVNPTHLEPVTQAENTRRAVKDRAARAVLTARASTSTEAETPA